MNWWNKIYYKILNLPLKLIVKSEAIPTNPIKELGIDPNKKILYVLPYASKADLLTVRNSCLQLGLSDPLKEITINGVTLPSFVFLHKGKEIIKSFSVDKSISIFHQYLDLHRQIPDLDIQMVPVSVLFGRKPNKEGKKKLTLRSLSGLEKFFVVLRSGRDCFVRYSKAVSLRYITEELGFDETIAQKLMRVAGIHFSRQRAAAIGPQLPIRKVMFNRLLESPAIKNAIEEEAKAKNISIEKATKSARSLLNEIGADFNYRALRIADVVLTWTWNRLYQGLEVYNSEHIRKLAQDGYEIVYAPCHRSHMDYLLLSYVLYRQGLVPPHIAAGINLNFWPAGPIFRHLGAFFIRRSFKGNKLYTVIFREYLNELFIRGYSVEYFVEGGRSRTGRLLKPMTGTLSITVQSMLRKEMRPIVIVPVYIGYEHVMEVGTYTNELKGAKKEKESLWLALRAFTKLRNLGRGYINFGQPIPLTSYLNNHIPHWKESIRPAEDLQRPSWLSTTVNDISHQLMENINAAAVVNAVNLCGTIVLSSKQNAITKEFLLQQLKFYLSLLKNTPYSGYVTIPTESPEELFNYACSTNKFIIETDKAGDIIRLSRSQAIKMTYYRNNIQHLIVLPALITRMIINLQPISREDIIAKVTLIYPLLKGELFIYFDKDELYNYINNIINELIEQSCLIEQNGFISVNRSNFILLQSFSFNIDEILERYMILLTSLEHSNIVDRTALEKHCQLVAERLSILHGINSPEFFDKNIFSTLISMLKDNHYLNEDNSVSQENIEQLYKAISKLISPDVKLTISSINLRVENSNE